jgi:hypothetical protein
MTGRQQSPPPVVNKKEANVFESTQMDPFVAVSDKKVLQRVHKLTKKIT